MKKLLTIFATVALILQCRAAEPTRYVIKVEKEYPHSVEHFTQGLFFHDGVLYESCGGYGKSLLIKYAAGSYPTEAVAQNISFSKKFFMEGSVVLGERLYLLSWTNNIIFTYDTTSLDWIESTSYPREGWGLTTNGTELIASDGSSNLYFLDPQNGFATLRHINVTLNGKPVGYLNELEWIDGKIWANVFTKSQIVIINPKSGVVEGVVDCSALTRKMQKGQEDVLNGIAYNPQTKKIYITGKNWSSLFEISLSLACL